MIDCYLKLKNRKLTKKQQCIEDQIICYVENKYGVQVQNCLFCYNKSNIISNVHIFLKTEKDFQKVMNTAPQKEIYCFKEDGIKICTILKENGMDFSLEIVKGVYTLYRSFEQCALRHCYAEAFEEIKKFREKHFNSETMVNMGYNELFITYKSEELMKEAESNGEQQHLIDEFYKLIKKYDEHNFITKTKGLVFYFDYLEIALRPRQYSDLFYQRMTRSINECAVIKENSLTINSQIYNQKIEKTGDGSLK